jgi:ribonuclease HI
VDASQEFYSAVAYMRNNTNKVIVLRFVQAKSCLKPIKAASTIPRMELMAAEMGLALANKLMATLDIQHQEIFLWTDSRAVHAGYEWSRELFKSLSRTGF